MTRAATAFSPASVGNVAAGFDLLGHAVEGAGDSATVTLLPPGSGVVLAATTFAPGLPAVALPTDPAQNTAGRALLALQAALADAGLPAPGFSVALHKGIALGSGMGGSASSAVAAIVAAASLLESPPPMDVLYTCAVAGEAVASGAPHGDNVAPMLLGGLTLAPLPGTPGGPIALPVPADLFVALVHPHAELATKRAREVLKAPYAIGDFVKQSERLALLLLGLARSDYGMIARGLTDVLVEPRRAPLIAGFAAVKEAALAAGALGASISGAGPSVFGWFVGEEAARHGGAAMAEAFLGAGLASDVFVSPVAARGAHVLPARGAHEGPARGARVLPARGAHVLPARGAHVLPARGAHEGPARGAHEGRDPGGDR